MDITHVLSVGGFIPSMGAAGESTEFEVKQPLGAALLIIPPGYLMKSFSQGDTSGRQRCLKSDFFLS